MPHLSGARPPVGRRVPRRCDGGARMAAGGSRHARPCCGLLLRPAETAAGFGWIPRLDVMIHECHRRRADVGSGGSIGLGWVPGTIEPGMDRVFDFDLLFRHSRERLRRWATRLRRLWLLLPGAGVASGGKSVVRDL